ncbi:SET domain-containing protein [Xylariales sp. AK1849]|nr:SET domain-containing protein [Xylariales sp. AK1849]
MAKDVNTVPRNWPIVSAYLSQPAVSPYLTRAQLQSFKTCPVDLATEIPRTLPKGPSGLVKITPITDTSHPAKGQAGLFAARPLPPGSLILPYYGIIHSSLPPHNVAHEKSDYDLWLDHEMGLAVDAGKAGNEARFINDYRGVKDRPNAEFRECWDSRTDQKCMAVFVLPAGRNADKKGSRGIAKGEEVCVSYGKGFWGGRKAEEEAGLDEAK